MSHASTIQTWGSTAKLQQHRITEHDASTQQPTCCWTKGGGRIVVDVKSTDLKVITTAEDASLASASLLQEPAVSIRVYPVMLSLAS